MLNCLLVTKNIRGRFSDANIRLPPLPAADSSEIATTASFRRASPPPRHSSPRA